MLGQEVGLGLGLGLVPEAGKKGAGRGVTQSIFFVSTCAGGPALAPFFTVVRINKWFGLWPWHKGGGLTCRCGCRGCLRGVGGSSAAWDDDDGCGC